MSFDALFIAFLIFGWGFMAGLPWLAIFATRKGRGALAALPFALGAGWLGGLLVPLLGARGGGGLLLSFPLAAVASAVAIYALLKLRAKMEDGDPDSPHQPDPSSKASGWDE